MVAFKSILWANIKRRTTDGFSVGYNIIFPLIMIWLLGLICKEMFSKESITSYQYYGVVLVPFSMFMAIVTAAYGGKDDAYANTAERILVAPVSVIIIVVSKIIAQIIVITSCSLFVFGFSTVVWDVWSISYFLPISLLYISISFMIASIGTYIGLGMKNFMKIKNLLNVPIVLFALLAGCFYRFGTLHKGLQFVIDLSPLTWANRSIFMMMFDDNRIILYIVCGIFNIVGLIFTMIAIIFFKKEEYGNGELPSYEE
ncbi:MAG: ABC transporter permease [Lachnotalea sp.]